MLNKQIYRLEDQIKVCQAQHIAQSEEKKLLREAVSEANMELEVNMVINAHIHGY